MMTMMTTITRQRNEREKKKEKKNEGKESYAMTKSLFMYFWAYTGSDKESLWPKLT